MLPDFGWTELLVIAIVLIVVVGPKDLPRVVRGFSKSLGSMRKMAGDFRKQFDDALSEAEMDELKTLASDVKSMDPRNSIKNALNPLSKVGQEINDELRGVTSSIEAPVTTDGPASRKISPQEAYPQLKKTPDDVKSAKKPAAKKPAATKAAATKKPAGKKTVKEAPATAKARTLAAKKTTAAKKTPATAKPKVAPRKRAAAKTSAKGTGDKT